jgi:hypothetical protein
LFLTDIGLTIGVVCPFASQNRYFSHFDPISPTEIGRTHPMSHLLLKITDHDRLFHPS